MTEQGNIKYNTKGEKPLKGYQIVRVRNVAHSKEVLDNLKNAVLTILKNKNLSDEDPKWEQLLPQGIVSKINQLDDNDKKYDEFLYSVNSNIDDFFGLGISNWFPLVKLVLRLSISFYFLYKVGLYYLALDQVILNQRI